MRRWIKNILAGFSLLLCIAAVVLWVRSYWGSDFVSRQRLVRNEPMIQESRSQQLLWVRGEIRWIDTDHHYYPRGQVPGELSPAPGWWYGYGRLGQRHSGWEIREGRGVWGQLGFKSYLDGMITSWSDENEQVTTAPAWLPVAIFGMWPLARLVGWARRRRRFGAGRCAGCGYDLRATPQRCPECGRAAAETGRSSIAETTN